MARTLDVWFYTNKAGRLIQDDSGRLSFAYDSDYLKSQQPWPLSVSLPLQEKEFNDRLTRPFFSGLLPDDVIRTKSQSSWACRKKIRFPCWKSLAANAREQLRSTRKDNRLIKKITMIFKCSTNIIWMKFSKNLNAAPSLRAQRIFVFP